MLNYENNAKENITTAGPNSKLTIVGLPTNNITCVGKAFEAYACYDNDIGETVSATWNYDTSKVFINTTFKQHMYITQIIPLKTGRIDITVSYNGQSCSFTLMNYMQIYISPANHTKPYIKPDGTWYPTSEWNEKKNMEIVAGYLKDYLDNYYAEVLVTNIHSATADYTGRPEEAKNWMHSTVDSLYLALHSNAGANGGTTARGSVGYYNAVGNVGSLALEFVNAIDAILPTGSNRSSRTIQGDYSAGTPTYLGNLGELRVPETYGIPSVLIEQGFHDNPNEAAFLISNQRLLAETVGSVLVSHYNLARK